MPPDCKNNWKYAVFPLFFMDIHFLRCYNDTDFCVLTFN